MAIKQTGGTELTGLNPLAYMGVEPSSPPQLLRFNRQPTTRDYGPNVGTLWLVDDPNEVWILVEKPQNVAKWILFASGSTGNVSSFQMDVGTADPNDDGIVFNLMGENTNTEGDNVNTMRTNLNRTIEWPTTNAAGTEGVIYLDSNRFFHNYGDGGLTDANTFLGAGSGNFSLTGLASTGIGYSTLNKLESGNENTAVGAGSLANVTIGDHNTGIGAHSLENLDIGNNNTAVGYNALILVSTGDTNTGVGSGALANIDDADGNIALGYNAGFALTATDSFNILVGNAGVAGDNNITRIGVAGVHNLAYVSGITGVTIANESPMMVVNVGTDGQLGEVSLESDDASIAITQPSAGVINFRATGGGGGGSSNPFAFSAVQVGDSAAIANFTDYPLGANVALTELFDEGNNFYPGDGAGAPAVFTAPVTGKYYFEMSAAAVPGNAYKSQYEILTSTAQTYHAFELSSATSGYPQYSAIISLAMAETVTFTLKNGEGTGLAVTYVVSGNGGAAGTDNINTTRISGFLIPESSNGGAFAQPFSAVQNGDSAAMGTGVTYDMGANVALTELFDVGNNFYPGDGLGAPAVFTAPETGIYHFEFLARFGSTPTATIATQSIVTTARTYQNRSSGATQFLHEYVLETDMTIGDTATFSLINPTGNATYVVSGTGGADGANNINSTRISGYRIG